MAKHAKAIFRFTIQGNGRDGVLVKQPLSTNADLSISTDGAVSLFSPDLAGQYTLQPGWNQLIDPAAYLLSPFVRNYFAMFLPGGGNGQTIPPSLTLAGSTLDVGIGLNPVQPLVLALPAGAGPIYVNNWGSFPIIYDTWQW